MHNTPTVSVIVPCYNHEKYIEECISSIFNQTYSNFEVLVIDDGSVDNSVPILQKLKEIYDFELIIQENRGLSETFNRGLKYFKNSKYITFCASDDFWAPNKIELQLKFMELNSEIPMCYGKVHYVDEESIIIQQYDKQNDIYRGGYLFDDIFLFKLHPPVNYFFKRSIFEEIGYYDKDIYAEDYYMNLKIASKYQIGFINEYLSYYRVDSSFQKVFRFKKVSESHLNSISLYKNNKNYMLARRLVFLRMFHHFAPYIKYKLLAFKSAISSINIFYKIQYIKAVFKLIFYFK
ncbi:glycosyltransferase family 2 protein [Sphingobacterium sp. UBA2074]|uniref:glycosyltransferase family 2 protein n=1 Tax=Sphingobacterium sp. UBA2074 TaxID=1947487 RepID=UPI00257E82A7|nr:glycosyltransferase [Sphingobacterium sp. UBA2074]